MWSSNWIETAFSIISDRKGKLDTGLKFLKVGFTSVFFGRGVTAACLNPSGISSCTIDIFITLLILGNSISIQSSSNDVGIGSRLHHFGAADKINFLISLLLRGWKEVSGVTSTVLSYSWNLLVDGNLALICMIFSSK